MQAQSQVVSELARFLGALDYQVETWDQKVIDNLAGNPNLFGAFRSGSDFAKWDIYSSAKFQ